ncbi:MAG: hypothetical protein KJN75_02770 [Muriicola sp.]|nr:hypothetical protein [Muriicola sp.]
MKKTIIIVLSIVFGVFGCTSQKKLTSDVPFTIKKPTCQQFTAGREEGGSGFVLRIPIGDMAITDVSYKEVFFRGHVLPVEIVKEATGMVLLCEYKNKPAQKKPDLIMDADPKKEIGNQPPEMITKKDKEFPFELAPDEAVISFIEANSNKVIYYKIGSIKDIEPQVYPSRPKN